MRNLITYLVILGFMVMAIEQDSVIPALLAVTFAILRVADVIEADRRLVVKVRVPK